MISNSHHPVPEKPQRQRRTDSNFHDAVDRLFMKSGAMDLEQIRRKRKKRGMCTDWYKTSAENSNPHYTDESPSTIESTPLQDDFSPKHRTSILHETELEPSSQTHTTVSSETHHLPGLLSTRSQREPSKRGSYIRLLSKSKYYDLHSKALHGSNGLPRILKAYKQQEKERLRRQKKQQEEHLITPCSPINIAERKRHFQKRRAKRKRNPKPSPIKSLFYSGTKRMENLEHWSTIVSFLPKHAVELVSNLSRKATFNDRSILHPVEQTIQGALCFIDISGFSSMCETLTQRATAESHNNSFKTNVSDNDAHENSQSSLQSHHHYRSLSKNSLSLEDLDNAGISSSVEDVARNVSSYFGSLIALIRSCGGDVVKIGGDALVCLFSDEKLSLQELCLRAVLCSLDIQNQVPFYECDGIRLQLHIGISCGKFLNAIVGGVDGRYEYVLLGNEAFKSLSPAINGAQRKQVAVTDECHQMLAQYNHTMIQHLSFSPIHNSSQAKIVTWSPSTDLSTSAAIQKLKVGNQQVTPDARLCEELRKLISPSVLSNIDNEQTEYMADVRRVSAVFVNLSACIPDLDKESPPLDVYAESPVPNVTNPHERNEVRRASLVSLDRDPLSPSKKKKPKLHYALLLHQATEKIQKILKQFNGGISQILQDEKGLVMVIGFGMPPFFSRYDASRAVAASLEIQSTLQSLDIDHSIGVATGMTFYGTLGNDDRQIPAIISHRVNLAARLMSHAQNKHQIFCDDVTQQHSQSDIKYSSKELSLKFKGIEQELHVYTPVGDALLNFQSSGQDNNLMRQKNMRSVFRELLQGRNGLVDALKQILLAKRAVSDAHSGMESPIIFCKGAAGSGKTEILTSAVELGQHIGFKSVFAHAVTIHSATDFYIWRQILSQLDVEHPEEIFNSSEENSFESVLSYLRRLLRAKGLYFLFVIRSIHFVDVASLKLIRACIENFGNRIVFLVSARKKLQVESNPAMEHLTSLAEIAQDFIVPKLSDEECKHIICSVCECSDVDFEIVDLIQRKSSGNVLFMQEILLSMMHSSVIAVESDFCSIVNQSAFEHFVIPTKMMELLRGKFERLHVDLQLLLKVVSTLAYEFSVRTEMLHCLYPKKSHLRKLGELLEALVQLNLIEVHNDGSLVMFKEQSYQSLPYKRMLKIKRRQLHKTAAKWLMKRQFFLKPLKDNVADEIAYHLFHAVDNGDKSDQVLLQAIEYKVNSCEISIAKTRYDDAIQGFQHLLSWIESSKQYKQSMEKSSENSHMRAKLLGYVDTICDNLKRLEQKKLLHQQKSSS